MIIIVNIKKIFEFEGYIFKVDSDSLRRYMTCFRLSSHKLEIELGRFRGVERNERLCKLCSQNVVESEYHFLLSCDKYTEIRKKVFGQ